MRDTRIHLNVVAAAAAVVALMGCASGNHRIAERINPINGQPRYASNIPSAPSAPLAPPRRLPEEVRAEEIYNSTNNELQSLLSYVKLPQAAVGEVRIEQVKLTTVVTFVPSKKGFFPSGAYMLNKIDRMEDRSGMVFTDLVTTNILKVLAAVKDKAVEVAVEATYSAQADGLPVRNLLYKGDLGAVVTLSQGNTTLNGAPTSFRIAKGQVLSNGDLAALRAVSLSTFVKGKLESTPVVDKFVLTTTEKQGTLQRWVSLTVKISPR